MKRPHKIFTSLVLSGSLAACASIQKKQVEQNRMKSAELSKSLRIGMTKQELMAQGTMPANCRGNPKNIEKCEVQFLTSYRSSILVPNDYSTQKYETYLLTFDHEKLKMWDKQESERLQSGSQEK